MRWPAEWEPHERTLMGWPCRRELWGETLERARHDYAVVANAIARFEPVTMIANRGGDAADARAACDPGVEIAEFGLDDSWLRDCGPIYVRGAGDRREAVHFRFNAWGEKFTPWDRDAAVGGLIAQSLGDPVTASQLVLEGGSIAGDGEGTLLTTEQCLLHPSRNPGWARERIEYELRTRLGTERIVWLGQGLIEDRDTDGHVDLIAAFTGPGRALLQSAPEDSPDHAAMSANRWRAEAAGIEVVEMPFLGHVEVAGERAVASYLNLYVCNGAVIVPVFDLPEDGSALALIKEAFPDREVVAVPGAVLAYGGGGPHCITQQVPVA
jgi:agmatine deiminase